MVTVPDVKLVVPVLAALASIWAPAATVTVGANSVMFTALAVEWELESFRVLSMLPLASTVTEFEPEIVTLPPPRNAVT